MLIPNIARTWVVQRDSVNTSIKHFYLTLPHNGRIHGISKVTGINKGFRISRLSRQDPKAEDQTGRVGKAETEPHRTDVGCPKPILTCVRL